MRRRGFLMGILSSLFAALPLGRFGIATANEDLSKKVKKASDLIRLRSHDDIVVDAKITSLGVSDAIQDIASTLATGQTASQINMKLVEALSKRNLLPSMLGYNNYPAESSVSISPEFIHAVPSDKKIKLGDLVTICLGGSSNYSHACQTWTLPVGQVSEDKKRLLEACRLGLRNAISEVKTGVETGRISKSIQDTADAFGLYPVEDFSGYTMGKERIQAPGILSYWPQSDYLGDTLERDMILNIHVILQTGHEGIRIAPDGWAVRTKGRAFGAVATAMVLVKDDGGVELTREIAC